MLPSWYIHAVTEIKRMSQEDIDLFRELIQAAKEYETNIPK
jgi:hypothetical protein